MAYKLVLPSFVCILAIFFTFSGAEFLPSTGSDATTAAGVCSFTLYPAFCRSTLQPFGNVGGTVNDYGRITLRQSLSQATTFLNIVRGFQRSASTSFASTAGALADCEFLAQQNVDSLSFSLESVGEGDDLEDLHANDVQTLLSATLTNLDTCLDGLKTFGSSSSVSNGLNAPITVATQLCSVSLTLFDRGWVRPKMMTTGRKLEERKDPLLEFGNDVIPLRMSDWESRQFESLSNRRVLLPSPSSSVNVTSMVIVDRRGRGNFTTINDAIAAAPNNTAMGSGFFVIYVMQGTYREYVMVPKNKQYIMMIGDGIGKTVITGNRSVVDGSTTFNSSTFAVVGQGFVGINMTIRNTAGAIKQQAVALRNGADMSTFLSCSFEGYQDTLYTHSLRQFYRNCDIYGTVDFIFGNAAVVFQNCRIFARQPMVGQFNTITAQGKTDPNQNTGTVIQNCTVKAVKELLASNYTVRSYLGRPWKNYSTTVYMQSKLGGFIDPAGWSPWDGDFALSTLFYAEYSNTGPGSNTSKRVTWPGYRLINATDAYKFTVTNFTVGSVWLPATGVPFKDGL